MSVNYIKYNLIIGVALLLLACSGTTSRPDAVYQDSAVAVRMDSTKKVMAASTSFTGTFEFSEPDEDGYLYYKIEIVQQGDSIHGKLFAANYLSSSEGGYSNPNALMECDLVGNMDANEGDHFMSVMLTITKDQVLEDGAPFLYEKMNFPDSEEVVNATFWQLRMDKGFLKSNNGQRTEEGEMKMLVWEKVGQ